MIDLGGKEIFLLIHLLIDIEMKKQRFVGIKFNYLEKSFLKMLFSYNLRIFA
jgi:hypothetical protein